MVLTITEFENKFKQKSDCAKYFHVHLVQLKRYKDMGAIVYEGKVFCPAIKKAKKVGDE